MKATRRPVLQPLPLALRESQKAAQAGGFRARPVEASPFPKWNKGVFGEPSHAPAYPVQKAQNFCRASKS
jgi:hypothetical protein